MFTNWLIVPSRSQTFYDTYNQSAEAKYIQTTYSYVNDITLRNILNNSPEQLARYILLFIKNSNFNLMEGVRCLKNEIDIHHLLSLKIATIKCFMFRIRDSFVFFRDHNNNDWII
jgi:hypothetical protein